MNSETLVIINHYHYFYQMISIQCIAQQIAGNQHPRLLTYSTVTETTNLNFAIKKKKLRNTQKKSK